MRIQDQSRRPNLATIVGSSLAVVAAGSLLAFSSLAERAGLDGLATGGLQPMHPSRSGGGAHAITIPAPATAPPGDPRDAFTALVRGTGTNRDGDLAPDERVAFAPVPRDRPDDVDEPQSLPQPQRPSRVEQRARVALAGPDVDGAGAPGGPPYGHAYGYHKKHGDEPKHAPRDGSGEHAPKKGSDGGPVEANHGNGGSAKPPKVKKVDKVRAVKAPKGKAKGHAKHVQSTGDGKARGHAKQAKGKGKAKGHSNHGG